MVWTERGAHTLMGQCVEYEVANVFDPAYTSDLQDVRKILLARLPTQVSG